MIPYKDRLPSQLVKRDPGKVRVLLFGHGLLRQLVALLFLIFIHLYLAAPGLSCGSQDLCPHCSMWDLRLWPMNSQLQHTASSSLNRDGTWAPCIGSVESWPLDHPGNPWLVALGRELQQLLYLWVQPTMDRKYSGEKIFRKVAKRKTWICHLPVTIYIVFILYSVL